jgi:hypothetical protein
MEVLNEGSDRDMGNEGIRTREPATLNRRKSNSIIANKRFQIVWGSLTGHWRVVFGDNDPGMDGFLQVLQHLR